MLNQYKNYAIVYGLIDPFTHEIKYIGKSVSGIERAHQHWSPSSLKEGNTHKNNWIKKLRSLNKKYNVVVLFAIEKNKIDGDVNLFIYNKEQEFINLHNNTLTNLTDGGPGATGRKISDETRKKMSEAAKKRGTEHLKKYTFKHKTEEQKQFTKLKTKEKLKLRNRKIPGSRFLFSVKNGKKVIAKDSSGNEIIGFYNMRGAAEVLGGKCNKTGIKQAIKNKSIYYGFYWEYLNA